MAVGGGTLETPRVCGSKRLVGQGQGSVRTALQRLDRPSMPIVTFSTLVCRRMSEKEAEAKGGHATSAKATQPISDRSQPQTQPLFSRTTALTQACLHPRSSVYSASLISVLESLFPSLCVFLSLHLIANFLSLCLQLPIPGPLCFPLDFTCLPLCPSHGVTPASVGEWLYLVLPAHLSPCFSFSISLPASPSPSLYARATWVTSVTPQGLRPGLCDFTSLELLDSFPLILSLSLASPSVYFQNNVFQVVCYDRW